MKSYANTYREVIKIEGYSKTFTDWRSVLLYFGLKLVNNAKRKAQDYMTAQRIGYTYTITTVSTYKTSFDGQV